VCESNKIGRGSTADGGVSTSGGRWLDVKLPQFGCWGARTLQYDVVVVSDCNNVSREGYITPGIAQLSNGDEGLCCKVGNDVSMLGRRWKPGNVKVSFMRGVEDDAGWVCMATGVVVGRLLHMGVEGEKKCVVQPKSAMA